MTDLAAIVLRGSPCLSREFGCQLFRSELAPFQLAHLFEVNIYVRPAKWESILEAVESI